MIPRRHRHHAAANPNDDLRRVLQQYSDAFDFSYLTEELCFLKKGRPKEVVVAWTQLAVYVFKRRKRVLRFRVPFAEVQQLALPVGNEDTFSLQWHEMVATFLAPNRKTLVVNYQQLKTALHASKERDASRQIERAAAGKDKALKPAVVTTGPEPEAGGSTAKEAAEEGEARNHPILLSFLVDSEFIDYGALRSVYDRMQAGEMRRHLRDYAEEQRQSLERLCANQMESFLATMARVSDISCDAADLPELLQARAAALTAQVHATAEHLQDAAATVNALRLGSHNIQQAMAVVRCCIDVAQLDARASQFLQQRKYYPALLTMEQLQERAAGLPDCKYGQYLRHQRIPAIQAAVLSAVRRSFNEWLAKIRALGDAIGARALEQAREQLAKRTGSLQRQAGLCRSAGATVVATAAGAGIGRPDSSDASDAEDSEEARARAQQDEDDAEQEALLHAQLGTGSVLRQDLSVLLGQPRGASLSPGDPSGGERGDGLSLYSCQRIYERLHRAEELQMYLMEQHQRQLEQELNALRRLPGPEWLSGAEVWYARLAGFFVIEDVLRKATSPPLVSDLHLCALWEQARRTITSMLRNHVTPSVGLDSLASVTDQAVQFGTALHHSCSYDLDLGPLLGCVEELHRQFLAAHLQRCRQAVEGAVAKESYAQVLLDGPEAQRQAEAYGLPDPLRPKAPARNGLVNGTAANGTAHNGVPKPAASYTATVIQVLDAIYGHLDACLRLSQHVPNEGMQEAVEELLQCIVERTTAKAAKLGRNHVVQLAQLHANAAAVLAALPRLEDHFARHTIRRVPEPRFLRRPRAELAACAAGLEQQAGRRFAEKVADCAAVLTPALWARQTKQDSAHNFFTDLVQYLTLTLNSLDRILPAALTHDLRLTGFAHIADALLRLADQLLDPAHDPTDAGYFKQDLQLLLTFAADEGVEYRRLFGPLAERLRDVSDAVEPIEVRPAVPYVYTP
eukprot:EG_transcript_2101